MIKKCIVCDKKFHIQPYRKKTARYCSKVCMGKDSNAGWNKTRFQNGHIGRNKGVDNRIEKNCLLCDNSFKTYLNRVRYCSKKCYWRDLEIRMLGDNNPEYINGRSPLIVRVRGCRKTKEWRSIIFKRDRFTCQGCGQIGMKLVVHHKKAFSKIWSENNIRTYEQALRCKELWNLENGETLCESCHELTDNYKNKKL